MISIAIGELGVANLQEVYDMTWAEFMIRLHAFKRTEKNDWRKVRAVAYQTYLSGYHGKGKPKTIEGYMPIDQKKKKVTDSMRKRMKEAVKQYEIDKNG